MDSIKEIFGYIGVGLGFILTFIFDKALFLGFMYIIKLIVAGISNIINFF